MNIMSNYKRSVKDEVWEVMSSVRWQTSRVARTKEGEDRDRFIKNLKMSLNNAISKLAMILMIHKDDKDGLKIVETVLNDFDRMYEMMDSDDTEKIKSESFLIVIRTVLKTISSRIECSKNIVFRPCCLCLLENSLSDI